MSIIQVVAVLCVLGLVWWLFSTYVLPRIPEPFRTIIIVVLVLFCCFWLLNLVGLLPTGPVFDLRR